VRILSSKLETFVAVVESGSFELASAKLHITPSAVSLRISALEAEINAKLLLRRRPCTMTQQGKTIYKYALLFHELREKMLLELASQS
jgi:LysR family transcriptional regulator (chromosome initiation inhibitor)